MSTWHPNSQIPSKREDYNSSELSKSQFSQLDLHNYQNSVSTIQNSARYSAYIHVTALPTKPNRLSAVLFYRFPSESPWRFATQPLLTSVLSDPDTISNPCRSVSVARSTRFLSRKPESPDAQVLSLPPVLNRQHISSNRVHSTKYYSDFILELTDNPFESYPDVQVLFPPSALNRKPQHQA